MVRKTGKDKTSGQGDIFTQPDAEISLGDSPASPARDVAAKARKEKPRKAGGGGKKAPSPQRYLPGLSRRGRPRVSNPVPAVQRALAHRQRRAEAGDKRVELLLAAEVATALEFLAERSGESRAAIVARLVLKEEARLLRRKSALAGRRDDTD